MTTPEAPGDDERPVTATETTTGDTGRRSDIGMLLMVVFSTVALVVSFVTLAGDDGDSEDVAADGGATVSLTEFAISPEPVVVEAGGEIQVVNAGSQLHNLAVADTDLITADLLGGESGSLDVSSLSPGEYELFCEIAGHADAGMKTSLQVTEDGAEVAQQDAGHGAGHGGTDADWAALDEAMMESVRAFPAETEGKGNVPLEPEILPDGTKRFELTASIVEWEVEPGKFVEGWAYNGMVPGPWMRVEVGDNVQVQIQNDLPMGTDIHWHGVRTPNDMDGVAPITQDLISAGDDFLYEFVAERKAVGMYHAHSHGQMQVPNGLLGVFQIGDVDLPAGRTISGTTIPENIADLIAVEYPMVLNDAGTIGLSLNGKSFPATEPIVVENGEWILAHYLNEGLQSHPMHQHQFPQLVVAKDGIPLDNPYFADTVNVAPGERYTVLFQADTEGTWVWHCHILTHVEREEGMFGMVTAVVVQ